MGVISNKQSLVLLSLVAVSSWIVLSGFQTPNSDLPLLPREVPESSGDEVVSESFSEQNADPATPTPRRQQSYAPIVSDPELDNLEEDFVGAMPLSSPLSSISIGGVPLLFRPRRLLVSELRTAADAAATDASASNYQVVVGRWMNESQFQWDVRTEVFTVDDTSCLALITLSRPRSDAFDKYRHMVNENEEWQELIANELGPDAFRVVAKSSSVVELGTTVLATFELDEKTSVINYTAVVRLSDNGVFQVEVEHLHRAYGAFTDVDRRGAYCPLPPAAGKGRKSAPRPIDFDNRVRERDGRQLVKHTVHCRGVEPKAAQRDGLPFCTAQHPANELLDGRYVASPQLDSETASSRRNFSVLGEEFRWSPRTCQIREYSSVREAGALLRLFQTKRQRILFLGDSQMRTMVNAFFSTLFNEPPAENNRGEYRKVASISSSAIIDDNFSWLEFLWDPQGEILTRFDLIVRRDVRRFENLLSAFLKKRPSGKKGHSLVSSFDLPHTKRKNKQQTITQLPLSSFSPEGVSWLRSWKFWKEGKPTMIVIGFGGWNMWLCESFEEAENRLRKTVRSIEMLQSFGIRVVFVGWPAPIDSVFITAAKRRMTSSRIGMLMELTRVELAAAGAIVLPLFEMAMPFPNLSSKHSASHYDNTTILYGVSDFIATLLG